MAVVKHHSIRLTHPVQSVSIGSTGIQANLLRRAFSADIYSFLLNYTWTNRKQNSDLNLSVSVFHWSLLELSIRGGDLIAAVCSDDDQFRPIVASRLACSTTTRCAALRWRTSRRRRNLIWWVNPATLPIYHGVSTVLPQQASMSTYAAYESYLCRHGLNRSTLTDSSRTKECMYTIRFPHIG